MLDSDMIVALKDEHSVWTVDDYFSQAQAKPESDVSHGGTNDIEDASVEQKDDRVTVSFTRKMDTGDAYDHVIKKDTTKLIYAWDVGAGGHFNKHSGDAENVIEVNFGTCSTVLQEEMSKTAIVWSACAGFLVFCVLYSLVLDFFSSRAPGKFFASTKSLGVTGLHPLFTFLATLALFALCLMFAALSNSLINGRGKGVLPIWLSRLATDVVIFYSVVAIALFAFYLHLARPWTFLSIVHRQVRALGNMSMGELFVIFCFIALNGYWFAHWFLDDELAAYRLVERIARVLGHSNELNMALLVLPVTRNSVWFYVFGIPFERAIKYHRWIGATVFVNMTLHLALWWRVWDVAGKWSDCALAFDASCGATPSVVWTGELAWLLTVVMAVLSYEWVRRKRFELFYYAHHMYVLVFVFACIHSSGVSRNRGNLIKYLMLGAALYVVDRVIRFYRSRCQNAEIISMSKEGEITKLVVRMNGKDGYLRYQAGQYAFINIPSLSLLQWHPFTISSRPGEALLTFHIKDMGRGTFTHQLGKFAEDSASVSQYNAVQILVDGPYGCPPEFLEYDTVVLACGGIGVTPAISILTDLFYKSQAISSKAWPHKLRRVVFVWVVKDADMLNLFSTALRQIQLSTYGDVEFELRLFATHSRKLSRNLSLNATELGESLLSEERRSLYLADASVASFSVGRPDMDMVMTSVAHAAFGPMGVFVCGPESLVEAVQDASYQVSHHTSHAVHVHRETFHL
eukprot:GILJ01010266.1.p1 GENE.GILJ01010266.1~~GILJ01010266.1.p1  ORF type:complete len:799 (-),score=93.67 GILJ01010266.1:147-2372(-)